MNIYALIPSRNDQYPPITRKLFAYLDSCGVKVKSLVGKDSIFSAFKEAFSKINPDDDDIIILCHDDIDILINQNEFKDQLSTLNNPKVGFIGVAGTTYLSNTAVWWDHTIWKEGYHRGMVYHGTNLHTADITYYGKPGDVVVLDGLFLAAKARLLKDLFKINENFTGKWDFYDIFYTAEAYKMGYINKVVPIIVMHNSYGELAGRESWLQNRKEFIMRNNFPIKCAKP